MMTIEQTATLIDRLERLPAQVEHLVTGLTPARLTTHFLPDEWTVAQNVHHLADSHMSAYCRCKLIMTEDNPTLKPYDQDRWAVLPDARDANVSASLTLLRSLHARWVNFFRSLNDADWLRAGFHPEVGKVTLADQLRLYAAHGAAHIDQMRRTLAAQYPKPPGAKPVLLERIDHEWDALNRLLVFLTPEELETPTDGGWSPKLHMAHLAAWEQYLLINVMDCQPGHVALGVDGEHYTHASMEQANALIADLAQAKSCGEVQVEFIATHTELHQRLELLSWDEMMQPRTDENGAKPLIEQIIANTYDHYLEHWLALPVV